MKAQIRMIIASVIVIALALTAVSGITYSWFSDTEQSKIDVSTAVVDFEPTYTLSTDSDTETSSIGTTLKMGTATTDGVQAFTLDKLAANQQFTIISDIDNKSTVKTVYRMYATWEKTDSASITDYDIQNISINGKYLTVAEETPYGGSSDAPAAIITDWTLLAAEADPSPTNITIATPTTYGDKTDDGYALPDGTSYTTGWDTKTARSGLTINIVIEAYQGDYPISTIDDEGEATIPVNGIVKGSVSNSGETTAKDMDVTVDFSNVQIYTSDGKTGSVIGKKISIESEATGSGTMAIGSVATVKLTLLYRWFEGYDFWGEVENPIFDEPVVVTAVIEDVDSDPGTVEISSNNTTEGIEIISSVYNATAQTLTVTFSTTHFSLFNINSVGEDTVATIGETCYRTLSSAIEAYSESDYGAGRALVLQTDFKSPAKCKFNKDIIIDLNGHTYYFTKSLDGGYNTEIACNFTLKNGNVIQPEGVSSGYFSIEKPASGTTITFEDLIFSNEYDDMEGAIDVNLNNTPNLTVNLNVTNCTFNNKEIEIGGTDSGSGSTVVTNIKSCTFNTGNVEIDANENSTVTTTIESCTFNNGKISIDSDEGSTVTTTITLCTFNSPEYTGNSNYVVYMDGGYTKLTTVIDDCDFTINGLSGNSSAVIKMDNWGKYDLTVKNCDFDVEVGEGGSMNIIDRPRTSSADDFACTFESSKVKVHSVKTSVSVTVISGTNITLYIGDSTTPDEWTGGEDKTVTFT